MGRLLRPASWPAGAVDPAAGEALVAAAVGAFFRKLQEERKNTKISPPINCVKKCLITIDQQKNDSINGDVCDLLANPQLVSD